MFVLLFVGSPLLRIKLARATFPKEYLARVLFFSREYRLGGTPRVLRSGRIYLPVSLSIALFSASPLLVVFSGKFVSYTSDVGGTFGVALGSTGCIVGKTCSATELVGSGGSSVGG